MKTITVNGRKHEWGLAGISYEEAIELAGLPEGTIATVTWCYLGTNDQGSLIPNGESIVAHPSLVISAHVTDGA